MARGGGGDGEEAEAHPFRWLDAARYAAASMVTVLILIVVVKASKVVLFPDSLYVSVVHGSVLVARYKQTSVPLPLDDRRLYFYLKFRVNNPGKHASMYYVNVTTYLFDNDTPASSSNPEYDSIAFFVQQNIIVSPQEEVGAWMSMSTIRGKQIDQKSFDLLYNNESASMSGVTMRMDATLLTEDTTISGRGYNTSRRVTYYCWPLVILHENLRAVDADAEGVLVDDVFCRDVRGSRFI